MKLPFETGEKQRPTRSELSILFPCTSEVNNIQNDLTILPPAHVSVKISRD